MRAITCALIALWAHRVAMHINQQEEAAQFVGGLFVLASFMLIILAVILTVFGL